MSKYIIELDDRIKLVTSVGVTENGVVYTTSDYVHNLEELNSDYINEHFGELQQDAYDRGYKDGRNVTETQVHDDAYQRGLDEAWKAARRISVIELNGGLAGKELMKIYGTMDIHKIYDDNTASEAIEKLKAYEEKQKADDKIEVGDEVRDDDGETYVITCINDDGTFDALYPDGTAFSRADFSIIYELTGRHFDIASILEAMRHD